MKSTKEVLENRTKCKVCGVGGVGVENLNSILLVGVCRDCLNREHVKAELQGRGMRRDA